MFECIKFNFEFLKQKITKKQHSKTKQLLPSIFYPVMSHNENSLIIGDYKLGKTIGKGTFGKVKLGTHLKTKEKVLLIFLPQK